MSPNQSCRLKVSSKLDVPLSHHSLWSDNHVASATENVLAERESQHWWRIGSVDHSRSENECMEAKDSQWWLRIQVRSRHKKQPIHPTDRWGPWQSHSESSKKTLATVNCSEKHMETCLRSRQKRWQPRLGAGGAPAAQAGASAISQVVYFLRGRWRDVRNVTRGERGESRERDHDVSSGWTAHFSDSPKTCCGHRERTHGSPSQDHHNVPGSIGSEEDGACGRWRTSNTSVDDCSETGEIGGNGRDRQTKM